MARPITLFTGQWADLPFDEVCRLASEWGYDGLELACWGDHFEVDRALGLVIVYLIGTVPFCTWLAISYFNTIPGELEDAARTVDNPFLRSGLQAAIEDVDAPEAWPRTLVVWRSNLLGSSAKGNEYFLRHLLGTDSAATAQEAPPQMRPTGVVWADEAPEGKLDLLMTIDFRMTSSTILSDIVLPAPTLAESSQYRLVNNWRPEDHQRTRARGAVAGSAGAARGRCVGD